MTTNRLHKLHLFAAFAVACCSLAQSASPPVIPEPAAVALIAANQGDVYSTALEELTVTSRNATINALIAHLKSAPLTGETTDAGTARVVIALGRLRAEAAAAPLASRVALTFVPSPDFAFTSESSGPAPFVPAVDALCQTALISIGNAALHPVLDDYEKTRQNPLAHAKVIVGVLDDDPDLAKAWLAKRQSSKKAADELTAVIDARLAERSAEGAR